MGTNQLEGGPLAAIEKEFDVRLNALIKKVALMERAICIAYSMARELKSFCNAAEQAGDHLPQVRQLVDEWDLLWRELTK